MLAHVVGWPTVALALVLTVRRAIKNPGEWWRLIGGISVLLGVLAAIVIISVVVLGTQVPGFHLPALTRTAAPAATASPQPATPATATSAATASPSHSGVYAGQARRGPGSVQRSGQAADPRPARSAGFDPDRRPHVCELSGVPVGGHEPAPGGTCARCSQRLAGPLLSGRGPGHRLRGSAGTGRAGVVSAGDRGGRRAGLRASGGGRGGTGGTNTTSRAARSGAARRPPPPAWDACARACRSAAAKGRAGSRCPR